MTIVVKMVESLQKGWTSRYRHLRVKRTPKLKSEPPKRGFHTVVAIQLPSCGQKWLYFTGTPSISCWSVAPAVMDPVPSCTAVLASARRPCPLAPLDLSRLMAWCPVPRCATTRKIGPTDRIGFNFFKKKSGTVVPRPRFIVFYWCCYRYEFPSQLQNSPHPSLSHFFPCHFVQLLDREKRHQSIFSGSKSIPRHQYNWQNY